MEGSGLMNAVTVGTENGSRSPTTRDDVLDVRGGAAVICGDGTRVGTLVGVLATSAASHVTALVVRDIDVVQPWHPVRLADVSAATRDRIDVTVTPRVLRQHTFPTRVVMVNDARNDLWDELEFGAFPEMWMPPEPPRQVPVTVPDLEPGEVLMAVGMPVYADRRLTGHLRGMRIEHATGRLTALVVDVRHRWHVDPVLVPVRAVDELSEETVRLQETQDEVRRGPSADERRHQQRALFPAEPNEVGVAESEPDSAHVEAARMLADEAEEELVARGFTNDEIRHWAEAYCREQRSGDLETFLDWVDLREHQSRGTRPTPDPASCDHRSPP
jgi:hypothetical protein